jgi:radical SAM protein with 4Fe4S-binding SPASM domain
MLFKKEDVTEESLGKELGNICERLDVKQLDDCLRFPKYFQIETTRLCNSRCTFCAIDQWDKSTPFMSANLFNKIASEMADHVDWIEYVAVQRAGEPLMDKDIVNKIAKLKKMGIKAVDLSTNASLLTEDKARALIDAGIDDIMFSIDSVEREKYTSVRIGLDFDTVLKNIRTFIRIREEMNPDIIVRVRGVTTFDPESEEGRSELESWEKFWNPLKKEQDRIYMKRAHNWGNQLFGENLPEEGMRDIYHPCVLPWSTMHVTAMGTVPLCPQDYDAKMNIGDVNKDTIQDIWQGANWEKIREQHRTGMRNEIPFCRGCILFDRELSLEK